MSRRNSHRDRYDDEEDEEDEDEEDDYEDDGFIINDEDDEEEEEEEEEYGHSSSRSKKKTKSARSLLIDDAAIDSDGEEEDYEDEEEEGFIDYDVDQPEIPGRSSHYIPKPIVEEENLEEIANNFNRRFQQSESFRTDTGVLSRSVLPTNADPSLWMLRCKPGKEKDILLTLMKRSVNHKRMDKPYGIESAFYRDNLKGYIYVESYKSGNIQKAVAKIPDLYVSKITLIPRKEMVEVLNIKNKISDLAPGQWARVKKGKYAEDLCQIIRIIDAQNLVRVKLIPRLDIFMEKDKDSANSNFKRGAHNQARPPQRLFDRREVEMANSTRGAVVKSRGFYLYNNEAFRDGFLEKNFKASALLTAKVNPSYEEITSFADAYEDEKAKSIILSTLTAPLLAAQRQSSQLHVGDFVEITEGSMKSILGTLEKIEADEAIVIPQVRGLQKISVALNHVRKCYREGDYVKVVAGKYKGETGSVVRVSDNVATVISDNNTKQIQVFTKDLGEANLSNPSTTTSSKFRVHEVVQLDHHNVGVVVKINNDNFKVIDQNGLVKDVNSQNLTTLSAPRKAVAIDSRGNPLNVGDQVRATHVAGRQGTIIHICKGIAFIKSQEDNENAGIFVEKTHFLMTLTPTALKARPVPNKTPDGFVIPTNIPAPVNRGGNSGRNLGKGGLRRRDPLVEKTVLIRTGPYKGLLGIVKDIIENLARVELHTTFRIVTVDKSCVSLPGDENDNRSNSGYSNYGASPRPRNSNGNSSNWSSTPSHPGISQSSGFNSRAGSNYNSRNSTPSHSSNWVPGNRTGSYGGQGHSKSWNGGNATPSSNNYRTPNDRTPNQNRPSWGNTRRQRNSGSSWESGGGGQNKSTLSWDFGNNPSPKTTDSSWDIGNNSSKTNDNSWDSGNNPSKTMDNSWDSGNNSSRNKDKSWDSGGNSRNRDKPWDSRNNSSRNRDKPWDSRNNSSRNRDSSWDSRNNPNSASANDADNSWDFGNKDSESSNALDQSWGKDSTSDNSQSNWGSTKDQSADSAWNSNLSTSRKSRSNKSNNQPSDSWDSETSDKTASNDWNAPPSKSSDDWNAPTSKHRSSTPSRFNDSQESQSWDSSWANDTPADTATGDGAWDAPVKTESRNKSRDSSRQRSSWGASDTNDSDWGKSSFAESSGKAAASDKFDDWAAPTPPQNSQRPGKNNFKTPRNYKNNYSKSDRYDGDNQGSSTPWSNDNHDSNQDWNNPEPSDTTQWDKEDAWAAPISRDSSKSNKYGSSSWDDDIPRNSEMPFSKPSQLDEFAAPSPALLNPITPGGAVPFTPGGEISFTPSDTMSFLAPLGPNLSPEASNDLAPLPSNSKKYRN